MTNLFHVFHVVWVEQNELFKGMKTSRRRSAKGQDFSWLLHNIFLIYIYVYKRYHHLGHATPPARLREITFLPEGFSLQEFPHGKVATLKYLKSKLLGRTNPNCHPCSGPWNKRVLSKRYPNLWPCKQNLSCEMESWNPRIPEAGKDPLVLCISEFTNLSFRATKGGKNKAGLMCCPVSCLGSIQSSGCILRVLQSSAKCAPWVEAEPFGFKMRQK